VLKAIELRKAFHNTVQILWSYWITDFSELHRELLKASQSQLTTFKNPPNMFPIKQFSFEKWAAQCS
jgi:hypothetical protein